MSANLSAHSFDVVEMILSRFLLLYLSIQFDSKYHAHAHSIPHGTHPIILPAAHHPQVVRFCWNLDGL
jgi:hypothetical protein